MKPNDLIGKWYDFYGAVDNCFRLDDIVYECVEDPDDGWRSMMCNFKIRSPALSDGLYKKPIARVKIVYESDYSNWDRPINANPDDLTGLWYIIDNIGHKWLTFGTSYHDAWYPMFMFQYNPKSYEEARHDLLITEVAGLGEQ